MKKTYECEYCGKVYDNEEDCLACEEKCQAIKDKRESRLAHFQWALEDRIKERLGYEKSISELQEKCSKVSAEIQGIKDDVAKEFPNYMISASTNEDGTIEVDIDPIPENNIKTQRVNSANFFQILNDFVNLI